jgi:L-asparaginase II
LHGLSDTHNFCSWKHTGVIAASQSGINMKDLQMQLRHHSLDMVNEYLKQLGVIDSVALRENFPTL